MFKTVVWATDGSDTADKALAIAAQITKESGGELVIVHCVELTMPGKAGGRFPIYANEDELKAKIQQQVEQLAADGVTARVEMATAPVGDAAQLIANAAREQGADVIVVGTRGRGPLAGLLLGSVTQRLLHIAPCPVLAIPTRKHEQAAPADADETAEDGEAAFARD